MIEAKSTQPTSTRAAPTPARRYVVLDAPPSGGSHFGGWTTGRMMRLGFQMKS
jgi:hypothetical protein